MQNEGTHSSSAVQPARFSHGVFNGHWRRPVCSARCACGVHTVRSWYTTRGFAQRMPIFSEKHTLFTGIAYGVHSTMYNIVSGRRFNTSVLLYVFSSYIQREQAAVGTGQPAGPCQAPGASQGWIIHSTYYMGPGVARAGDSPTSRAPPICFMLLFMDRIPRAIFRFIKNAAACTSYVPKCKVTHTKWMEVGWR